MSRRDHSAPIALELAAGLLVPAAAYGFVRVFVASDAVTPIIGAALLSSAVAVLLRRLRVPLAAAAAVSTVFLGALIVSRFAADTTRLGIIPTGATIDQFRLLANELVVNFRELKTPVEALDPFIATAMVAAWIMAFLTDWGALRLRLAFEPVLPAGLLFIFAAVLGDGTDQIASTIVFAIAVAFWAVAQRAVNLAEGNAWLAHDRRRGTIGVAQLAAVFAALAVLTGILVGPRLPGAEAEEMVSFRDRGDPTRVVVSPFVEIGGRLREQSSLELFTVTSDQPAYWRLAGLDTFDGKIWKVAGNFSPEDGALPGVDQGGVRDEVQQDFSIKALDVIWLPAAFAPSEIVETTANLTWNAETGSLTVSREISNSDGVDYTLISSVPRFSSEELRAASTFVPPEIAERYLPLPAIPDFVRTEARRITAGATTRYDQALALQDYLHDTFSYSIDVDYDLRSSETGSDPLELFLREQVGFCQQFAGAFAVMARDLGIPARVAIGFTWGDPVGTTEDGRTIFQVTGRQTHAWPEVWFDGLGWVAFEPTPNRGAPGAAEYTGIAAAQDSLIQPDNPEGPITTTTTVPGQAPDGTRPEELIPELDFGGQTGGGGPTPDEGFNWGLLGRIMIVPGLLGLYLGGVPAYRWYRRRQRRQQVDSPARGVETAWAEATETLELGYGLQRRPAETRREFAGRLAADVRVPRDPILGLANKATVARYYPQGLSGQDASDADRLASQIESTVNNRVSPYTRWKRLVDPRRLLRSNDRMTVSSSPLPSTARAHLNGESDRSRQLVKH